MGRTELRILGPIELLADGCPVALPRKVRRLLVELALVRGRACRVDTLVEAIWVGEPPPSARKVLQMYVARLRRSLPLGASIETRDGAYVLHAPDDFVDAERFGALANEVGEVAQLGNAALTVASAERALALWHGSALGEFADEAAVRNTAAHLDELRFVVDEHRLAAKLELGQDGVVAELTALAESAPLRERVHELLILALYRAGRQTDALEHYGTVRATLRSELGLDPGAALRALQTQILRHDPVLATDGDRHPLACSLPLPSNALVGREHELGMLDEMLERRESRLVVLTGAGGSGKTRLALEAGLRAAPSFANGAVFVDLAPLRDPALVPRAIADALDLRDASDDDVVAVVSETLATRELLLVVDNAEHLRTAATLFVQLVARAPRLVVVVTSRAVLHVSGEQVVPVSPLPLDDAVELFAQRASALDPAFALTDGNRADVEAICRAVDGLPLAVELAAARIRTLTPNALLARLGSRLGVLTGGRRDLLARQQTMRDTIAWSVDLLSDDATRVLARLSVFPDGATLHAAENVCGAGLDTLAELIDSSVVRQLDEGGDRRYTLFESIREYALELLADERRAVEGEMAAYFVPLLERGIRGLPDQEVWLLQLDRELDNIRAAIEYAAAGGAGEVELRLTSAMTRYWWIRGPAEEGLVRVTQAIGRAPTEPSQARAQALQGAASLLYVLGRHAAAAEHAAAAVEVARHSGSNWDEVGAQTVLGVLASLDGDYDAARAHHLRAGVLLEGLGLPVLMPKLNLGTVEHAAGNYPAAAELFAELVPQHRESGSLEGIGLASLNLGLALYRLGEFADAEAGFREARASFEALGFTAHVAHAGQGLAACAMARGRAAEAAGLLGDAARRLAELGWSNDDFDPTLAAEIEAAARLTLGDDVFAAAFEAGIDARDP